MFAYLPEGLIMTAIFAMVVGLAAPVFVRFGFSFAVSIGLGVTSGMLFVAGLVIRTWFVDTPSRARSHLPPVKELGNDAGESASAEQALSVTWVVRRQDDNGNQFVVQSGLGKPEADQLVAELEDRGHKQMYWAESEQGE